MLVNIKKSENGDLYILVPDKLQRDSIFKEGEHIHWIDDGDGSWTLKRSSDLDELKLKALNDPEVKAEYERLKKGCSGKQ